MEFMKALDYSYVVAFAKRDYDFRHGDFSNEVDDFQTRLDLHNLRPEIYPSLGFPSPLPHHITAAYDR